MCGIYGRWHRDGASVSLAQVEAATTQIRHRGPDDEGYLVASAARRRVFEAAGVDTDARLALPPLAELAGESCDLALGFRRLSILDLSPAGHQPMRSEDGRRWLVFNGEIYNYVELRAELAALGHVFHSGTDSEVLLAAYSEWGSACLARFNGMWAFAIWDVEQETLFLARDRFGVKPLFYAAQGATFTFASEIKALVGPHGVPFAPSAGAVFDYLVHGRLPSPRAGDTFFEGVRQLPPGHHLTVTKAELTLQRYYELSSEASAPDSADATAAAYGALLADSVRLRLRADVAVGSCLSGGVDSSSIVCLANGMLRSGGEAIGDRQKTISAVYDGSGRYNERAHIDTVIAATGTDARFVYPTEPWLRRDVERLVWHQDEPFTSTSIFAQWCVMSAVHDAGVTVLLDGQGADEALAGYRPFEIVLADRLRRGRLREAARLARAIRRVTGDGITRQFARAVAFQMPAVLQRGLRVRRTRGRASLLRADFAAAQRSRPVPEPSRRDLQRHLWEMTVEESLPHLLRYEDRNSMAFHVEARVPFVDYRLVEFAFQRTGMHRVRDGWSKWPLRRAMQGIVPEAILWRRDKVGFETPESEWLRTWLSEDPSLFADDMLAGRFVEPARARALAADCLAGTGDLRLVWRIMNLELWLRVFGEGQGVPGAPAILDESLAARS